MKDIPRLKETGLYITKREEMDLLQMLPRFVDCVRLRSEEHVDQ